MEKNELVLVIDFGGQYNQLIARRVRENNVYCEIVPYDISIEKIKEKNPKGIIFTGGPSSVFDEDAPRIDREVLELGIPVLGICYGCQLIGYLFEGKVEKGEDREYGRTRVKYDRSSKLFKGLDEESVCWMSHTLRVVGVPEGYRVSATTESCPVAAMENADKGIYGVQFHPEVEHTLLGREILKNFLFEVCNLKGDWNMGSFTDEKVNEIRKLVGSKKVICAMSGGVDSSVAAVLVHKAVGKQLTCIFVDHGLLRKNEGDEVVKTFKDQFDMNLIRVDAKDRFLGRLAGVSDPERKRKIIGEEFIRVFEEEARKLGDIDYLVQGTIYPDVVESGTKTAATIKSHHNVGGLPENMNLKLIEPLRTLFKDEVRKVGEELKIPRHIVWRQPFPGPGLAIRVLGDITEEKLAIVREADAILREEVANEGLDSKIWQYFACLPNIRSVGVMGDERTYMYTIALRAVTSSDGMTSDWAKIPYDVLGRISNRIVNEVQNVNRVVYDITSKPPATIEWE
jgi:GMP synthase (glutamine-hydrolyzing), C-terminal domain or B subunit/GMP synthase (glutamine-hydrolyzing), N-terminal domain or A subunit